LPENLALTGPTLAATVAVKTSSPSRSIRSQPGMQRRKTSGSFSARHTASRAAGMRTSPVRSMVSPYELFIRLIKRGRAGRGQSFRRAFF